MALDQVDVDQQFSEEKNILNNVEKCDNFKLKNTQI